MAERIEQANGPIDVVDRTGIGIAAFTRVTVPQPPYPREQVEAARQHRRATGA
jgi:hypothetical protein